MAPPTTKPSAAIEWSAEARPFGGAGGCGDVDIVVITERGAVVAVADGLGHGPEAVIAARTAADVIQQRADAAITELITDCHHALRKTRGAALSIAVFACHDGTMTWLGVGNVSAVLARADPSARPARRVAPARRSRRLSPAAATARSSADISRRHVDHGIRRHRKRL